MEGLVDQSGGRMIAWPGDAPATPAEIEGLLRAEGMSAYSWSNAPGDRYPPHSHGYRKVIYVVRGSITFGLPDTGARLELHVGDRLELDRGVIHDAIVGPQGVECLEAHR
jgi:quercetin dioxygenase-like cupin family protein